MAPHHCAGSYHEQRARYSPLDRPRKLGRVVYASSRHDHRLAESQVPERESEAGEGEAGAQEGEEEGEDYAEGKAD